MKVLQHLGLVVGEDDGFVLRYNGEMFRRWYRLYGAIGESSQHDLEIYEKLKGINQTLADKYLSAWRTYNKQDLPNYSGVLAEMRGVLENLVDSFASKAVVQAQPGFKLDTGQSQATLRQQIEFMVRQKSGRESAKQTVLEFNLFDIEGNLLAQLTTKAHRTTSGMVHDTATREQAAKALRQWDSILFQLLG